MCAVLFARAAAAVAWLAGAFACAPNLAHAQWAGQCPATVSKNSIGCQPPAATPLGTDILAAWQIGQNPPTRALQVQQLLNAGLPATFSTIAGNPVFPGNPQFTGTPSFANGPIVTVVADNTGVADAAPGFRAAMGSNRVVVVPPGTYRFKSTDPHPPLTSDPPAVWVQGANNLTITGYGATIIIDNSIVIPGLPPLAFQFDTTTNLRVEGLTIQGNRTGLGPTEEAGGIALTSVVNARLVNNHFTGNFGGLSAPFVGDWIVNTTFEGNVMDAAGIGFDLAFLKNVSFVNNIVTGANASGTVGFGDRGISIIQDIPFGGTNRTGVSFTATDGVVFIGNKVTGFIQAVYLTTGTNYLFSNNYWYGNPGAGGSPGFGINITYIPSGPFSSVGAPVSKVTITGDHFASNGATVAGAGLRIDPGAIANGDVMSDFVITGNEFFNNAARGIETIGTANVANILQIGNMFSGAAQTTPVDANTLTLSRPAIGASTLDLSSTLTMANNIAIQGRDGGGIARPILAVNPVDITFVRPAAAAANTQIQNYAGTSQITVQGGTNGGITFNNHIAGTGTAPTLSACGGGSPALSATSTDWKGTVTQGTTASGCTVTFNVTYPTVPDCGVYSLDNHPVTGTTVTTTQLIWTNAAATGAVYRYDCVQ